MRFLMVLCALMASLTGLLCVGYLQSAYRAGSLFELVGKAEIIPFYGILIWGSLFVFFTGSFFLTLKVYLERRAQRPPEQVR